MRPLELPALVEPEGHCREPGEEIRLDLLADPVRVELGEPDHAQQAVLVNAQGLDRYVE